MVDEFTEAVFPPNGGVTDTHELQLLVSVLFEVILGDAMITVDEQLFN